MPSGSITITPGKQLIAGERITNTKVNQGFTPTGRVDALSIGTRELIPSEVQTMTLGFGSMPFSTVVSRVVTLSYGLVSFQPFEARAFSVPFMGAPAVLNFADPSLLPPTLIVTGTLTVIALSVSVRPAPTINNVEVLLRNVSSVAWTPTAATPAARLRITLLNFAP